MGDNGTVKTETMGVRIGVALANGPLTVHGACLVALDVSEKEWKDLTTECREHVRSQVRVILEGIPSACGRLLAEDKQGRTTIYFLTN